jgi:hypothetical protein
MFNKKPSREWLRVAASLVVFLSGTMLTDVDTQLMETASDEWLADFDGDGLAEMALGRLPVRTAVEASRIIDKLVDYEIAPRNRNILLVSDLCEAMIGSKNSVKYSDVRLSYVLFGDPTSRIKYS